MKDHLTLTTQPNATSLSKNLVPLLAPFAR